MPDRKKNNRIIIAIICLFIAVTISGLFIIDAVLNNDIEKRNQETATTESTEKMIEDEDIKNEIQTEKETTEKNDGGWEKPEEPETQESVQQPIETTTLPPETKNSQMISIGNDILQNVKPVDSTLIKKMGEEKYYFKTYIENNTKYTITSITLSYQVSPNDFTYIMYQGSLAPGQKTEELSCSAASGTETYPLFSEEITFLDETGNEHVMSYNAITKEMQCY